MKTIIPGTVPQPFLHSQLLAAIAPRPIAFAGTVDKEGNPNLAPFSFFNVFSSNPPIVVFSPARSGRTGKTKNTLDNVIEVPEVVINIVNYAIAEQCNIASTEYEKGINEYIKAGLTPIASDLIKPFRVKESPVQLECKVIEVKPLGDGGGAGNLIIAEVLKMHIAEEVLDEHGKIDQFKMDLVARMGYNFWCRAGKENMFKVTNPVSTNTIGFDRIPNDIKNSSILSGNDLGKLANIASLPDETEVNEYKLMELSDLFIEFLDHKAILEEKLHHLAKIQIEEGKINEAWKTLLAFNNR
jgi:flavin reductase (DIM6/NTAB) family NADH-FMN oxidoreductase RutF